MAKELLMLSTMNKVAGVEATPEGRKSLERSEQFRKMFAELMRSAEENRK